MTPPASGGGLRAPIPLGARVTTESGSSAAVQRGADAGVISSSANTGSTLTQLFAAKGTDAHDEQAAGSLASAFSVGATTPGRPARAADGELSLDHLFRDRESGQPASVTMDEFYRTEPAREKGEGVDSEKANERTADIRQFTSWLEGLKKK
jgi:hypothetical protein